MSKIAMVDLRPMLTATEPAWQANLRRMFERMQFVLGEQVAAFEVELAEALGAKFAVTAGTGTAAIELCLRATSLAGSGAEVIVPALTSLFTAQAVLAAGFQVRFADVDEASLLLDPAAAEAAIGKRTRAILPVHLYGQPCEMKPLASMARRHKLILIQDACQAHGAQAEAYPFTRYGPAAYSFYPTKNLPCLGDGGAVVTDNAATAARLRMLRDGGRRNDQVSRLPAINSRLDEMQACYLRAFLPKLGEWNDARIRLAARYDEALSGCAGVTPVKRRTGSVCHLYVVRAARRDRLRAFLADQGILTGIHYPVPLHLQPAFRGGGAKRGDLPVAERACREILSLPLWPYMREQAVDEVAARIHGFYA